MERVLEGAGAEVMRVDATAGPAAWGRVDPRDTAGIAGVVAEELAMGLRGVVYLWSVGADGLDADAADVSALKTIVAAAPGVPTHVVTLRGAGDDAVPGAAMRFLLAGALPGIRRIDLGDPRSADEVASLTRALWSDDVPATRVRGAARWVPGPPTPSGGWAASGDPRAAAWLTGHGCEVTAEAPRVFHMDDAEAPLARRLRAVDGRPTWFAMVNPRNAEDQVVLACARAAGAHLLVGPLDRLDETWAAAIPEAERIPGVPVPMAAPRAGPLAERVRDLLARILLVPASDLDVDAPLRSLGIDSMTGLEVASQLQRDTGVRLPDDLPLDRLTARSLAEWLGAQTQGWIRRSPGCGPSWRTRRRERCCGPTSTTRSPPHCVRTRMWQRVRSASSDSSATGSRGPSGCRPRRSMQNVRSGSSAWTRWPPSSSRRRSAPAWAGRCRRRPFGRGVRQRPCRGTSPSGWRRRAPVVPPGCAYKLPTKLQRSSFSSAVNARNASVAAPASPPWAAMASPSDRARPSCR